MKILLVNPAIHNTDRYSLREIPLGLAYIENVLQRNGYDCELFDFQLYNSFYEGENNLLQKIRLKPNIIGLSCNSFQIEDCKKIITYIKKHLKECLFVVGGIHATFVPESFNDTEIDYIIQGEGEKSFLDLISNIEKTNNMCSQNKHIQISNILSSNMFFAEYFPNYDKYIDTNAYSPITVITSRGCSGNCKFCSSPKFWGHLIKHHSVEWLKNILVQIGSKNINKVLFVDDDFFYPQYLDDRIYVLEEIHNKYKMTFAANSKIANFPLEKIEKIKQCGITSLSFGIETIVNDKCLYSKIKDVKCVKNVIDICKNNNIIVRTSWILGLPELGNDIKKYTSMLDAMIYLKPNELSIHWLVPYSGSYYYQKQSHLFNLSPTCSYNEIPNDLYNYLDNDTMCIITNLFEKELVKAGYSDNKNTDYYFYLPSTNSSHIKRSFY
jgi:radical SAM superfamily enzyme YgiQ (UPF0313 family)